MTAIRWLALDIGGANVKVADGLGYAQSYPFALWKDPAGLVERLRTALAEAPEATHVAVTMTGELADCFESKAAGVRFILQAVQDTAQHYRTLVYLVDAQLVEFAEALELPYLAAASNWHALANFAGRFAPAGPALLIDVGSTTCDVIPLLDGQVAATGRTDTQRLLAGELVYTGVERSPVCAIVGKVPYRGRLCPVVQEVFAHMRDAYVLLGELAEDLGDCDTSDGRPLSMAAAEARLGRMIAADRVEFSREDALAMAQSLAAAQTSLLASAIRQVKHRLPAHPVSVVLSGHGEFLARAALESLGPLPQLVSLTHALGPVVSRCAPAHAVAVLARETILQ